MMHARGKLTIIHEIQHRHPKLIEFVTNLTNSAREREMAWKLVKFIITEFPETAKHLNGKLETWKTED